MKTASGAEIFTQYIRPPIPSRLFDWMATTEDYDGAPDAGPQLVGFGETGEAAIADLLASDLAHVRGGVQQPDDADARR